MFFIGYPNWWEGLCRKCFIKENRHKRKYCSKVERPYKANRYRLAGRFVYEIT